MRYYGKITDNKDLVTKQYVDENGGAILVGSTDPTTSTVGKLNQLYLNTTRGVLFRCSAVGETYTWDAIHDSDKQDAGSGGGIVEVSALPSVGMQSDVIYRLYEQSYNGTAIPKTASVEEFTPVYINRNLSDDAIMALMGQVAWASDEGAKVYYIGINASECLVSLVKDSTNDANCSLCFINTETEPTTAITYWASADFTAGGLTFTKGWNSSIDYDIPLNIITYVGMSESNTLLKDFLSSTAFTAATAYSNYYIYKNEWQKINNNVVITSGGAAIPNSGTLSGTISWDTSKTVDEVKAAVNQLDFYEGYAYYVCYGSNSSSGSVFAIEKIDNDNFIILTMTIPGYTQTYIFSTTEEAGFLGWNPDVENHYDFTDYTFYSSIEGMPIGAQNNLIKDILYLGSGNSAGCKVVENDTEVSLITTVKLNGEVVSSGSTADITVGPQLQQERTPVPSSGVGEQYVLDPSGDITIIKVAALTYGTPVYNSELSATMYYLALLDCGNLNENMLVAMYYRANNTDHYSLAGIINQGYTEYYDGTSWTITEPVIFDCRGGNLQEATSIVGVFMRCGLGNDQITDLFYKLDNSFTATDEDGNVHTIIDNNNTMIGASDVSNGKNGLVTAPQAGDQSKVLKGDGTWGYQFTEISSEEPSNKYDGMVWYEELKSDLQFNQFKAASSTAALEFVYTD